MKKDKIILNFAIEWEVEMDALKVLNDLGIEYDMVEYEVVFTMNEAQGIRKMIDGVGWKENKRADLNYLWKYLEISKITFGSEECLQSLLGLVRGVTLFGIINDKENKVVLLLDEELVG